MWRSVGIEFPKCPATSCNRQRQGKKNFRRCGTSIQEISAQQVIPMDRLSRRADPGCSLLWHRPRMRRLEEIQ
jgi:hypothetical protein